MRQLFPTCESPIEITLTRNVVGLAPPDDDADDDERFDDVPLIAMRARMQQTDLERSWATSWHMCTLTQLLELAYINRPPRPPHPMVNFTTVRH
jgi:hypothetical protein